MTLGQNLPIGVKFTTYSVIKNQIKGYFLTINPLLWRSKSEEQNDETNKSFVLAESTLLELLKFLEWDIILDLIEMQTSGYYFNKELELTRSRYSSGHDIYLDSFERVFSPSKFLERNNRLGIFPDEGEQNILEN